MAKHVNSSSFSSKTKPIAAMGTRTTGTGTRTSGSLAGTGLYSSNQMYGERPYGDRYVTTISFKPNSTSSRLYLR
jgi:hypothetical protein